MLHKGPQKTRKSQLTPQTQMDKISKPTQKLLIQRRHLKHRILKRLQNLQPNKILLMAITLLTYPKHNKQKNHLLQQIFYINYKIPQLRPKTQIP
jgi:hypothetical protein